MLNRFRIGKSAFGPGYSLQPLQLPIVKVKLYGPVYKLITPFLYRLGYIVYKLFSSRIISDRTGIAPNFALYLFPKGFKFFHSLRVLNERL